MGFLDWIKGKQKATAQVARPDELITVYDERGRQLQIKRAEWVAKVLAPALEKAWNDPKQLSVQIVQALRDDFLPQISSAAERLLELDPEGENSLLIGAVVRMETGDLDGAERALQRSISKHGESGAALTNLAKVLDRRGRAADSRATLRRALDVAPNEDGALLWWAAIAREERGDAGYLAALGEVASRPGAWRPQLWLAREKLKQGDRAAALSLHDEALARAPDASDVLTMVTGDLGNAGALEDLVRLGAPRYKPEVQGPSPGMNLIQAYKQLGRLEEARGLVRRMQAMGWAPLAASLAAMEAELAAASLPKQAAPPQEIAGVAFDSPLWMRGLFDPSWLLPPRTDADPFVALFTFSDETAKPDAPQLQVPNASGRLARILPIYLAEALRIRFQARVTASILVIKDRAVAVPTAPLGRETLEASAASVAGRRLVVSGALVPSGVRLEIWEIGTAAASGTFTVGASLADVADTLTKVELALAGALEARGLLPEARTPPAYGAPPPALLPAYASALEQLLYQVLAASEVLPADSLWNERGFFETYLGLLEAWKDAPDSARLIAICGVGAAVKYKSALLEPYRTMALKWVDGAPPASALHQLAPAIFKRLEDPDRYARWMQQAAPPADASYRAWLERVKTGK